MKLSFSANFHPTWPRLHRRLQYRWSRYPAQCVQCPVRPSSPSGTLDRMQEGGPPSSILVSPQILWGGEGERGDLVGFGEGGGVDLH